MAGPSQRRQDVSDALPAPLTAFEADAPVDEEGEIIQLDSRSSAFVTLALDSDDNDVIYQIQARGGLEEPWFDFITYEGEDGTGTGRIRDTVQTGTRFQRLVVIDGSDNEDATADVSLQASG